MGAAVSVMSRRQQEELFPGAELQPSRISLRTYTAERVQVLGALPVQVTYGTQVKDLHWVIVQGGGPALAWPHQAGLASYCLSYSGQVGVGGNIAEIPGSVSK